MPYRLPSDRPFTTGEALALGLSRRELDGFIAARLITRCSRGRYQLGDADYVLRAHALARLAELHLKSSTSYVAAHETAAIIHGLRTPDIPVPGKLTVLCSPQDRRPDYNDDVTVLPARCGLEDIVSIYGVAVTSLERTALDLARGLLLSRSLVSLDHALALGVTRDSLMAVRDHMSGWPGTRILNQAIELADSQSETALESASRGAMLGAGLPAPRIQVWVEGASGAPYRTDFAWVSQRVIGESDGLGKFSSRGEYNKQIFRDSDLREAGWTVVHWTFEQIMKGERPALQWLATALNAPLMPLHRRNSRGTRRVA